MARRKRNTAQTRIHPETEPAPEAAAPQPAAPQPAAPQPAAPQPAAPESVAPQPAASEPAAPEPDAPGKGTRGPRAILGILSRPLVYLPLLVLAGFLGGYVVGAIRLARSERAWDGERAALEGRVGELESSLSDSRAQEASYRVLVSVSRVVVHLYEGNFGLASEELAKVQDALADTPVAGGGDLGARLDAFRGELDELSRRVEEASRSARETLRDIERVVTTSLFPTEP